MSQVKSFVALALLVAAGFWGYRTFFPSDEILIRKCLDEAVAASSFGASDTGVSRYAAVRRLMNLCTDDVRVVINAPGRRSFSVSGKEQLGEALAGVRATTESLSIELLDVGIEVAEDRTGASAQFVARVRAGGSRDEIVQEIRILLKRVDGDWKFAEVEPLASLSM